MPTTARPGRATAGRPSRAQRQRVAAAERAGALCTAALEGEIAAVPAGTDEGRTWNEL